MTEEQANSFWNWVGKKPTRSAKIEYKWEKDYSTGEMSMEYTVFVYDTAVGAGQLVKDVKDINLTQKALLERKKELEDLEKKLIAIREEEKKDDPPVEGFGVF